LAAVHLDLIVALAARHKLPTVYYERFFVSAGGLLFYGPDLVDQHRAAAAYVDLILKGKKPTDLPVQRRSHLKNQLCEIFGVVRFSTYRHETRGAGRGSPTVSATA
jgi:ABC-type uncharacterized transport system substrate-binding protein